MNPAAADQVRWSGRRWIYTLAFAVVLQLAFIWFLSQSAQRPAERPIFRTAVQFATDAASSRQITSLPGLDDPTLLALPSLDGFSGTAWLKFPTHGYRAEEHNEPTHALALDTNALATTFTRYVATNVITPALVADRPLPAIPRYEPNFPYELPPTQTLARIEGTLAARPLVTRVELKSWPSAEILSNTVVQAAVDELGHTFSATLLSGSGSTNADRHALTQVANARFRPAAEPSRAFTWGRWIFQWHTLPLPTTNVAATGP